MAITAEVYHTNYQHVKIANIKYGTTAMSQ